MYNSKDKLNTFSVYCHYFPNGKVYIGLSSHTDDIFGKRFGHDGCKYKDQPLVYRAIQKYGWDNIRHEIIAKYISRESAVNIEKDLIALYRSNEREHGYNISPGGEEGSYHSEESRMKMSKQRRGVKKSEEHKRKIGEARRGMKMSDEFCKKMSEIAKNRHHDTTNDPRNIPVLQYRISDGSFVARYISINEAERITKASRSHISECAKDKRRQVLGCVWIYESMATDEYIANRLSRARLHSLYEPVVIYKDNDFNSCMYFETITSASKYIGVSLSHTRQAIADNRICNGYYIKKIVVDEYFKSLGA